MSPEKYLRLINPIKSLDDLPKEEVNHEEDGPLRAIPILRSIPVEKLPERIPAVALVTDEFILRGLDGKPKRDGIYVVSLRAGMPDCFLTSFPRSDKCIHKGLRAYFSLAEGQTPNMLYIHEENIFGALWYGTIGDLRDSRQRALRVV